MKMTTRPLSWFAAANFSAERRAWEIRFLFGLRIPIVIQNDEHDDFAILSHHEGRSHRQIWRDCLLVSGLALGRPGLISRPILEQTWNAIVGTISPSPKFPFHSALIT